MLPFAEMMVCATWPILWLGGLALEIFWIWMLVECVTKEPTEGNTQLIWVVILVVTNVLGAILYFLIRRPERIRLEGKGTEGP